MAHQLSVRENGFVEMAFTGSRDKIWHGLGQELTPDASIETWIKEAGCEWEALESPIEYKVIEGGMNVVNKIFPQKKALFRSDTKAPLSIVGEDYKIVQPAEVIEFFRDLTEHHDMKLSSAGVLFGGQRFWALADTGCNDQVFNGDRIEGFLLLVTSVDGTLATTAKFVSTRVVCNNTLTIAVNGASSQPVIKTTHKKVFDPTQVKIDLGLINSGWSNFMDELRALSSKKMTRVEVNEFYKEMFYDPQREDDEQTWGVTRRINELMSLYDNGAGAGIGAGTAYGALNAVTNLFTHGTGKRAQSNQFWDSYFGNGEKIKTEVFDELLQMV